MGRHVKFNQNGYIRAVENALVAAMAKVEAEIYRDILSNFGAVNIREFDTQYQAAMRSAITHATAKTTSTITAMLRAGFQGEPNQSFRLVYYEYGTSVLMKPRRNYTPTDDDTWNDARPRRVGEPIWTRRYGPWKDAGGNVHFSKNRNKPKMLSPKSRRAQPIQAHYWFTRGFWTGSKNLNVYVLDAVKSVPIASYISIANIYKRM